MKAIVYGIGNPLIDILVRVSDEDLAKTGMNRGIMALVTLQEREKILSFIKGKESVYSCGGSCPNTVITLSAMGVKAALGGRIGKDEYGIIYEKQLLENENIISALVSEEGSTGSSIILVTPDSERTMNTYLGANRDFCEADVNEKILDNASFFYFTGYMWDTENQKGAIIKSLDICRKKGIKVLFDAADPFAVSRYRDDFLMIMEKHADYIFANNEEASILFDGAEPEKAVSLIAQTGKTGVVKWGKHGSLIKRGKEDIIRIPILEDRGRVDTTGAGDTYAAGFLYGICTGRGLDESGRCASILASAIVSKTGARFTPDEAAALRIKIAEL